MKESRIFRISLWGLACALVPQLAAGTQYNGRFTFGGYAAQETLEQQADTTRNDFATFSSRFYLGVNEITASRFQFVGDFRDKHDFFDKLDAERLTLTSANQPQVRQLSFSYPNEKGDYFYTLGRMPVVEAGSVFTDGLLGGYRLSDVLDAGIFGGLAPKRDDQTYVGFNRDSQVAGAYLSYDQKGAVWSKFTSITQSVVARQNQNHLDRLYTFNNSIIQFGSADRLTSLFYLDFTPRVYFQTFYLAENHDFSRSLASNVSFSAIDVIEYTRIRGVLERLEPSPYREGGLKFLYKTSPEVSYDLGFNYGIRLADGLTRQEISPAVSFNRFFDRHLTARLAPSFRHNFNSNDLVGRMGLGYYSDRWEFTLDESYAKQSYIDGTVLSPLITDLSLAHYFSRELFATVAFQYATDERAKITSSFFKLGYRFGSREVPPLRDGAPARGSL